MNTEEKLKKIKELADKMYSRMAYLTSDTRPIREAMEEYHQFIINEYHKEEPVSEDLEEAADKYAEESYPDEPSSGQFGTGDYEPYVDMSAQREVAKEDFKAGAEWQKEHHWKPSNEQMEALEKECIAHSNYELCRLLEQLKKLKGE